MPEIPSLEVQTRAVTGKKVSRLRRASVIPGVVYGRGAELQSVQVDGRLLDRFLAQLSASSLINVSVVGELSPRPAIIREVQRNPLTNRVEHIDFMQVSLKERIRASVPVVFRGEPVAVTEGRGILVEGLSSLDVECLPTELPEEIGVDVGRLDVDGVITVSDLKVPEGVTVHTSADHVVVRVIARREVVEEEVAPEATETQEVEVIVERKAQERREKAEPE